MLLIYVSKLTNRLGYTLNLVFKTMLNIPFEITLDEEYFCSYSGPKICYSRNKIGDGLYIKSTSLLYQTSVENQEIQVTEMEGLPIFFQTYGKDITLPFDIFAATFYLVSRYEEYLPHRKDHHQRFDYKDSLAYQNNFLHVPIVNKWADFFCKKIKDHYPDINVPIRRFHFVSTIDIDAAYAVVNKGLLRNMGRFVKDLVDRDYNSVYKRAMVMLKKEKDPFDTFDYILKTANDYHAELLFFVLFANYNTYDKNISPNSLKFQQLIKHLGDYAKVGIHPSYASFADPTLLTQERKMLASVMHKPIKRSRFHFLRFQLPVSYQNLTDNNIEADYSMGYSNEYGFRAGICTPFHFYDMESDAETNLTIHPFAVMDSALKKYLNLSPDEALDVLKTVIDEIKAVEGTLYTIWHNNSLCELFGWEGWSRVYEQMLDYAHQVKNK